MAKIGRRAVKTKLMGVFFFGGCPMLLRLRAVAPKICDLRRFLGVDPSRTRKARERRNLPHFCKRGAVVRPLVVFLLRLRDFFAKAAFFYPFHYTLIKKSIYKVYI